MAKFLSEKGSDPSGEDGNAMKSAPAGVQCWWIRFWPWCWVFPSLRQAVSAGEPAEEFLKRLRAARYFDTAILYLDRLDQYPGIDPELTKAIALEKAQTYIDAAGSSRSGDARDNFLKQAEEQLSEFLKQSSHPRISRGSIAVR